MTSKKPFKILALVCTFKGKVWMQQQQQQQQQQNNNSNSFYPFFVGESVEGS